jgi:integrase
MFTSARAALTRAADQFSVRREVRRKNRVASGIGGEGLFGIYRRNGRKNMARPKGSRKTPTLRLHKPSGRAVVTLDGRDHYLGDYGSTAAQDAYDRLVGAWMQRGRTLSSRERGGEPVTVAEVIAAFWSQHVPTMRSERKYVLAPFRILRKMYGETNINEFGPVAFRTFRATLMKEPVKRYMGTRGLVPLGHTLSRCTVNTYMKHVKGMMQWAMENELVSVSTLHTILAIKPLEKDAKGVRETDDVPPAKMEDVEAVRQLVTRPVRAMIDLQLLTGARPGELCIMRLQDIDMSGPVWIYRPSKHKTQRKGKERLVPIGPKAQQIVRGFMTTDISAYLFRPVDGIRECGRPCSKNVKSSPHDLSRRAANYRKQREAQGKPPRALKPCYSTETYHNAIRMACIYVDNRRKAEGTFVERSH